MTIFDESACIGFDNLASMVTAENETHIGFPILVS
jgi:hypothetical protein